MQQISRRYKRNFLEMHKKIIHQTAGSKELMGRTELQRDTSRKSKQRKEKYKS